MLIDPKKQFSLVAASCRDGGCAFRLGARWTAERLAGTREPHLRPSVRAERVRFVEADAGESAALAQALAAMRDRLDQIKENAAPAAKMPHG